MRVISVGLVLGLAVGVTGCGSDEIILLDPEVLFDEERTNEDLETGDPTLTIGFTAQQVFTPLESGDEVSIVAGFQGGTWIMPTLRVTAMRGEVTVDARVTVKDTSEEVGIVNQAMGLTLQPTAEGGTELVGFPIPIVHTGDRIQDPIDDVYGKEATMDVTITDSRGRAVTASRPVILMQGTL